MSGPIARVGYQGAALPASTDTEVLYDSTLNFVSPQMMGIQRYSLHLVNSHSGTLNFYKSEDHGTTWVNVDSRFQDPAVYGQQIDFDTEAYEHFKVEWVNGGTTQTTFIPSQALIDDANEEFSPEQLSGATQSLALWLTPFNSNFYALESGSAADLRRVDSLTNRGSLGGTMAQATSANKPVLATYPEGRALFGDGSNDRLASSLAASAFGGWHGATGTSLDLWLVIRTQAVAATNRLCGTFNLGGTNLGFGLYFTATGTINLRLGDGTGPGLFVDAASAGGVITAHTTHVVRLRLTGTSYDVDVDGTNVITGAHGGNTAGAPQNTLHLFASEGTPTLPFTGYIAEVVAYDRILSASEATQLETYLSRHTMSVTYDQLVTYASLWQLVAFFHSNGSAWVDRLGAYPVTEVGSPTHGTSAAFNNKNVMTLPSGANYAHFDALGSLFDGNDTSISVITAVELDALAAVTAMFSVGGSVNGHYYHHASDATPQWRTTRFAGASAPSVLAGTATTAAGVRGLCFRATSGAGTASLYDGTTRIAELAPQDVGSCSFNRAATGVRRYTANDGQAAGDYGAQVISTQFLNQGDYTLVQRALSVEFGL